MIFSIAIYGAPYSSAASISAIQFAEAATEQGHELYRVFFYHDGVQTASLFTTPPQDEPALYLRWQALARDHNIDLVVCVAAALKRGVLDQDEAERWSKPGNNLAESFTLSGLGQLVDATIKADRHITFGD
ncbi:Putative sulfurtransferase DsrE [Sinobacterium norvegicum]|uniref:Sulfurtransferase DsrE n=1 Tax=Sinobacterium norvegicum TaxID=1641715 RepID=A0ABM9AA65_9GAMM|nr:sulfurtransferase complex subunit TusD [Sinobacterium norvegicum]CAH0990111.1 Putative sulfurtransferase DsrE [Sinobacterium norvegicum]